MYNFFRRTPACVTFYFRVQGSKSARVWAATMRCATGFFTSPHQGWEQLCWLTKKLQNTTIFTERSLARARQVSSARTKERLEHHGRVWASQVSPASPMFCLSWPRCDERQIVVRTRLTVFIRMIYFIQYVNQFVTDLTQPRWYLMIFYH